MHKILRLCEEIPLLPCVLLAAIPLALWPHWTPWGTINASFNPGLGEWIVIVLVLWTCIESIQGMIDDLRHGQMGVDILAVVALISTVCVQQYWASWAVVLMVASGEAIETFAQSRAKSALTALLDAAPQQAHVIALPGVQGAHGELTDDDFRKVDEQLAQETSGQHHFDTVPVDDVHVGDVLIVLPGETVPVDGELLSGSATLDLSNINGEPVPRTVFAGARVLSGSVNGASAIMLRAIKVAQDSQYQHILQLVKSAQDSRAAAVRTADMLAVPFTVVSFLIAGIAWAVSGTPLRFAQVLVLATPCPLLIAAPVAFIAGTGRLARHGILIKTQDVLENLGHVNHVFFDKTGTLTVKQPQVVRIDRAPDVNLSEDELLIMAGVVEDYSVHILAKGIARAGKQAMERLGILPSATDGDGASGTTQSAPRKSTVQPKGTWQLPSPNHPVVRHIVEESGKGVTGEVDGHTVRVGRLAFVTSTQAAHASETHEHTNEAALKAAHEDAEVAAHVQWGSELAADEMATYVSVDGKLAARIVLRDVPRPESKRAVEQLKAMGITKLTMLTGDKQASAELIAHEVGIDDVRYELLPEDKVLAVRTAEAADHLTKPSMWDRVTNRLLEQDAGRPVTMMVGDGVNDAPVLAAADIGVAMTDGTSTAASESAQVVIMNDRIEAVPMSINIAHQTKNTMLQAVLAGLGLAIVAMICAAFNLIPVVIGAFLQEAIDVVSIVWAVTAMADRKR
ncbi:heavy metal translocating P-type ATPase [Bifidobacterium gallicum]|uniref:Heavy metal translocating P-type ATPase n=1 Tax=Bifidobacterium gallicum DSM 20093 = LMG 11596 TaxID=561180 RepID=D1NW51_9BIFI|nr:heavy metal translocating P-type ATPase [Bifidobacterium gallicum]EFA22337.1 heavy metal translocating P-type ATPase [Bifidobacterium gallicum DSM 20093 = LMG 11596]KFI60051.1 putative cation-transporting ATPase V [Bifidobacterium gallicum DSM 20093 = LMG 11596]